MKIKLPLLFACLITTISYSQIQFQTSIITDDSSYGSSASGSFAADLDGDNDLDLIVHYYEGRLVWYENKPNEGGLVEPKVIFSEISYSGANVLAFDMDNDGDIDIVDSGGYRIVWYENLDGLGNFGTQNIITTEVESVMSIEYSDLDGDGDFDVLSSSLYDEKVVWFENLDGLGNFGTEQLIYDTPYNTVVLVYAEDLDGDGDDDIILNLNDLVWLENIAGTFTTEHEIINTRHNHHFPVDLDSDGDLDIVVAEGYDDDVIWYENTNGLGSFSSEQFIGSVSGDVDIAYADDIDGDGDIDVLADGTGLFYYENDGNESFSYRVNIFSTSSNTGVSQHIYAADFDNDGDNDVISDAFISTKSGVAYSEYDQTLGAFKKEQFLCEHISNPIDSYAADVDNDGNLDILVSSIRDNKISWFEDIDGTQNFANQHIISTTVYNAKSLKAADIDADGDIDVFIASETDDKIIWFRNQGDGTFEDEMVVTTETNGPNMIQLVDFDDDGDLDVVSSSYNDDKLAWYENEDGSGSFGVQQVISTEMNGVLTVYTGDFDDDGDLDILSSAGVDRQIAWLENTDGQGSFGPKQPIAYGVSNATSMDIGDIDGDGDLDFLVGRGNSFDLAWYGNENGTHANGQFGYANDISTTGVAVVSLADIDNDGDLDFVATIGDDIIWYSNQDGLGDFSSGGHIMDNRYDKSFYAVDMDFDGDVDVISTRVANDQLAYSKNLGVLGNEINGTVQIDINGDGCDNQDAFYPNIMVVADNGSTTFGTFTLNNGTYQIPVNSGNFTTTIGDNIPSYLTSNPASYSFNYSNLGNIETANFCLVPNQPINDLNISIFPLSQARPGFDATYRIVYKNVGTEQLSGTINFQYDEAMLNFLSATETIASQSTNSLTFNYSGINSYESRTIDINFNVLAPPTVNIDDVLYFEATINPVSGDFTEEDNTFSFNQTVIGSFDPNDITCLEGDEVLIDDSDKYLHYLIRFQNTGTASAINIRVENILDDKLDWRTLQIETTSHTNRVEIKNGNELSFIFSGINLPDSTSDEPNSHGFIAYKIKPNSNVVEGDIVLNTADIYFDFNEAIVTNTAETEFVGALSIEEFVSSNFTIYPNPTKGILEVQSKNKVAKLEVFNNLGQRIMQVENGNTVNLSSYDSGIYFIKIHDDLGNLETKKIIKQ